MSSPAFPVFIARGDVRAEIDRLAKTLAPSAEGAGLHKCFYVARANQTVVMAASRDAPLAAALRGRPEWSEPVEPA